MVVGWVTPLTRYILYSIDPPLSPTPARFWTPFRVIPRSGRKERREETWHPEDSAKKYVGSSHPLASTQTILQYTIQTNQRT